MAEQHGMPFLRETLEFLVLAGVLIPLLQRFKVNQVLGFLAAGLIMGPYGLGLWIDTWPWLAQFTFPQRAGVTVLAEMGVLFLMFMIGLELSAERLWAMRRWVFGAGALQVLLSSVAIGALAMAFGNAWQSSLVLGMVLSLSSTAVIVQLLSQREALATPMGQSIFAVLMFQDLAVVPILILIDLLGRGSSPDMWSVTGLTLLKSVVAVVLIFVVGRKVIRPLFRNFARQRQADVFMALTLLATLSIAGLTAAAGLSMALGALLAGLLLAETEYRHEVEVTIEPFKGLLMGLFFMTVGMGIDAREILANPLWVPLSVIGLILIKATVVTVIFRVGGLSWGRSVESGLLLGQGGEFAFIVVGVAAASQLLSPEMAQFVLLVVGLTLFVTPMVAQWGQWLGTRLDAKHPPASPLSMLETVPSLGAGQVVVAGYGRVGQLIGELLLDQGVSFVAVEQDANLVAQLRNKGKPVFYGNAARPDFLQRLHVGQAAAVVVTMDQPAAALATVRAVRGEYPQLQIFARSRDTKHARDLLAAGANMVIPETVEAGLQLSAFVLEALGVPETTVGHVLDRERTRRVADLNNGAVT
ncbi:MAG: cation:proton antiporter [Aquabacterium sp.]|jgi:CPA2 family monovalent cation:H+ antiporter-2|uniref:cation:proton antiporter domain-containing protein n=1 Tax=Aquabacterium sp. TaxID=1872578 RepID=UPI002A35B480|nr:cation:proton antiporter [Aquabacterium sp.]MDX9843773.1 cation:proton antiporter [Aquabacterium sp.]